MRKTIHINIPQPCREDWNKMTPQELGRYCDSCQKCVTDFTQMSDAEIYRFMNAHKGERLCGRFLPSQVNRPIALPPQPHSRLWQWAVAAGLVLCFTTMPFSYTHVYAAPIEQTINKKKDKVVARINGIVYLDNCEPAPAAIVEILDDGNILSGAVADSEGNFSIPLYERHIDLGMAIMRTRYVGQLTQETIIDTRYITDTCIPIYLKPDPVMVEELSAGPYILGGIGGDITVHDSDTSNNK